ncbi:MAG: hypothetical protein LBK61_03035 [Spirochaetaceae bacterium]|jgi:hypothetical protein|nr:hypothetical protein [Spirochaetaceae bacterium]
MSKTEEAKFYEVLKKAGLTANWEAQVRAEGRVEGRAIGEAIGEKTAWEKVVSLMEQGYTVDQLKRMVPSGTDRR